MAMAFGARALLFGFLSFSSLSDSDACRQKKRFEVCRIIFEWVKPKQTLQDPSELLVFKA